MNTISFLVQFLPVIVGTIHYKKINLNYKQSRFILLYCILGIVSEVISKLIFFLESKNSMVGMHIYTLIEFLLLLTIFSKGIDLPNTKKYLISAISLYLLIWVFLKLFIENFNSFDNYSATISSAILASVSLYLLTELIVKNEIRPFKNPSFWFLLSVFIYHFLNFTVFFFYNINEDEIMWEIHSVVNIISQILMTIYFISLNKLISGENRNVIELINESEEIKKKTEFKLVVI